MKRQHSAVTCEVETADGTVSQHREPYTYRTPEGRRRACLFAQTRVFNKFPTWRRVAWLDWGA